MLGACVLICLLAIVWRILQRKCRQRHADDDECARRPPPPARRYVDKEDYYYYDDDDDDSDFDDVHGTDEEASDGERPSRRAVPEVPRVKKLKQRPEEFLVLGEDGELDGEEGEVVVEDY